MITHSLTLSTFATATIIDTILATACILILAESQYQSAFSVDKEINIMGMFYKLIQETK